MKQETCEGCGRRGTFEDPVTRDEDGAWHDACLEATR